MYPNEQDRNKFTFYFMPNNHDYNEICSHICMYVSGIVIMLRLFLPIWIIRARLFLPIWIIRASTVLLSSSVGYCALEVPCQQTVLENPQGDVISDDSDLSVLKLQL